MGQGQARLPIVDRTRTARSEWSARNEGRTRTARSKRSARNEDRTRTTRSKRSARNEDRTRTARSEWSARNEQDSDGGERAARCELDRDGGGRAAHSKEDRTRGLSESACVILLLRKLGNKLQLQSITLSTTGYLRSSSPYHPRGAPIFPKPPTKKTYKQGNCCKARKQVAPHSGIEGKSDNGRANPPPPALSHLNMVVVAFSGFESVKVWFRRG